MSIIEVSGLASVMIFFLFLFMAPALVITHPRLSVDLAQSYSAEPMPAALKDDAINVSITRDEAVLFNNQRVKLDDLAPLIEKCLREGSERKVYLRVDARSKYVVAKVVLDQIRLAGIADVALITEEVPHRSAP